MENILLDIVTRANADYEYGPSKRKDMCRQYSWAVPNEEAIQRIVAAGPVVEIGAGNGYWAGLVASRGGDIIAYDAKPYANHWCAAAERFAPVLEGGPEMAQKHSDRTLFLCWPPYAEALATDALLAYEGKTLIYVGEGSYGCTGDQEFHELLYATYKEVEAFDIPKWWGSYDWMQVFHRRQT